MLVVDDDPSLRLLCRVNLELDGFGVTEAATLAEARAAVASRPVSAVLLDVHVGRESGLDLLAELKAQPRRLPVVLLTGESGLPPEARGRADAVLSKPFEIRQLAATISQVLG